LILLLLSLAEKAYIFLHKPDIYIKKKNVYVVYHCAQSDQLFTPKIGDYAEPDPISDVRSYSRYPYISLNHNFFLKLDFDKIIFSSSDYNNLAFNNNLKNIFFGCSFNYIKYLLIYNNMLNYIPTYVYCMMWYLYVFSIYRDVI